MRLPRVCIALLLLLAASARADVIRQVSLPANDLVYDPVTQRIYASVPSSAGAGGNSITVIDPETGAVGPPVFIGSEPNRLALSDDGQYLYVALDGAAAIRRFDMKSQTAGPQFPLGGGQIPGPLSVEDMQVMPGHPQTVAVSRLRNGVVLYDNGVPRPKTTTYGDFIDIITFGRSADRLYGFDDYTSGAAFTRMAIDASGLTVLDKATPGGLGSEMKFADGLIYGSSGLVIDPETRQLVGTFKGLSYRSSVAPDPAAGKVYFLTAMDPSAAGSLLTFDAHTFLPLGAMSIPGVKGQAGRLIRWGQERSDGGGLAFRTDQGQVFLISLAPSAPAPADLALTASAMPNPVAQGAALTVSLTVTNTSATPATGVVLTESLPAPLTDTVVSISASQGQCRQTGSQIVCDLGALAGGAQARVTLVLQPGATNPAAITSWSVTAALTAHEPDPNSSNNQVETRVTVLPRSGAPAAGVRQLALAAKDLAYDRVTHQIYASVPSTAGAGGNSITAIDPGTGAIGASVFIGSEPGKLALSDDGQYLYVALDGAAAVRRFDMATQTAGPQFSLGADSFLGPYYVEDLAVVPGNPRAVAVSRKILRASPGNEGVAIYDDGVPRGKMTTTPFGIDVIAFGASPARLYGYNNESTEFGFRRMTVDASGVTVDDVTDDLITGFGVDIRYDQGLIFSTSGREIDPEARKLLGTFGGLGFGAPVAPDVKAGRVYFLTGDGPTRKLLIFDPKTFLLVSSREIPGVMGRVNRLIRWGQERSDGGGLAFGTDQGQVFLIALNPLNTPTLDFSLALSPNGASGDGGVTATVTLTAPAPPGGVPVALASSNPAAATVPPALVVPAGALTASIGVTVHQVPAATDVVITASAGGVTHTATLHLIPSAPPRPTPAAQLLLLPNPVPGGLLALGQVILPQPAGAGGATVTLTSSRPAAAIVPAAAFVLPGASTVTFPIVTFPVTNPTPVTITASGPAGTVTAILQLLPLASPPPALNPPVSPAGAPAAPTALSAQVLSPTQVRLFWRDNSDNETAFAIWRRDAAHDWARVGVVPPNTTTFTDTGLAPGTAYTYRVRATNNVGASDWSNEVTVVTLPAPAGPQNYAVTDLGALDGVSSVATGINSAGHVVGWVSLDATNKRRRAFLYDASGMHDLGPAGSQYSIARGINDHDQIIGESDAIPLNGFLLDALGFHPLGAIGKAGSQPAAVNNAGQVVGTIYNPGNHAFLWTAGKMIDLGTLGGEFSDAQAINNAGQVVGLSSTLNGQTHAFLYDGSGMHDLGTLGGTFSDAFAINDEGQVVGQAATAGDTGSDAFLFDRTGRRDLGTLGGAYSVGHAINNEGWVVGSAYTPTNTYESRHAVLYVDDMLHDLNALIPAGSGWTLVDASGINDVGQIVGEGLRAGATHAYLLTPRWPAAP